jgi:hypothetical protein
MITHMVSFDALFDGYEFSKTAHGAKWFLDRLNTGVKSQI